MRRAGGGRRKEGGGKVAFLSEKIYITHPQKKFLKKIFEKKNFKKKKQKNPFMLFY